MKTKPTTKEWVCCSPLWRPLPGEQWEVQVIEQGHVFAWRKDENRPSMQYLTCLGCGKAYHHGVFPPPIKKRGKKSTKPKKTP